jgi:hypothetical protein
LSGSPKRASFLSTASFGTADGWNVCIDPGEQKADRQPSSAALTESGGPRQIPAGETALRRASFIDVPQILYDRINLTGACQVSCCRTGGSRSAAKGQERSNPAIEMAKCRAYIALPGYGTGFDFVPITI